MKFPGHLHTQNNRHALPLPPLPDSSQICTIYEELKRLPATARVRVKSTDNGLLLYASNKSVPLETISQKNSSLQEKRQALISLLKGLSDEYAKSGSLNRDQRGALDRLRMTLAKRGDAQDFTAGELKNLLKPLNNSVRTRKLLLASKRSRECSEIGNQPLQDMEGRHYQAFLAMEKPTRHLLKLALFGHQSKSFSLAQQRSVLNNVFELITTMLSQKASRTASVRLIRNNTNKDALLEFSIAWQAARKQRGEENKMLDKMSWKGAIDNLSVLIQHVLTRPERKNPLAHNPTKTSPVKSTAYLEKLQHAQIVPKADTRTATPVFPAPDSLAHGKDDASDVLVSSTSLEDPQSLTQARSRHATTASRFADSPFVLQRTRQGNTSVVKEYPLENSDADHGTDTHWQ